MLMVAADVRRQQPHHGIAHLAITLRLQGRVKVVRDHPVSELAHRRALGSLGDKLQKSGVVAILVEDSAATITAAERMVAITTLGSACGAWHGYVLPQKHEPEPGWTRLIKMHIVHVRTLSGRTPDVSARTEKEATDRRPALRSSVIPAQFTGASGHMFCYDKVGDRSHPTSTAAAAQERYFYEIPAGSFENVHVPVNTVERALSVVESTWAPLHAGLIKGATRGGSAQV